MNYVSPKMVIGRMKKRAKGELENKYWKGSWKEEENNDLAKNDTIWYILKYFKR